MGSRSFASSLTRAFNHPRLLLDDSPDYIFCPGADCVVRVAVRGLPYSHVRGPADGSVLRLNAMQSGEPVQRLLQDDGLFAIAKRPASGTYRAKCACRSGCGQSLDTRSRRDCRVFSFKI
jgi:hypothetical protein